MIEPRPWRGRGEDTASKEKGDHRDSWSKLISRTCSPCKLPQREKSNPVHRGEDARARPAPGFSGRKTGGKAHRTGEMDPFLESRALHYR